MKRVILVIWSLLFLASCGSVLAGEASDQNVLKMQMVESRTLNKNDINALSMGRNNNGKFGVEIWLTKRFAGKLEKIVKSNPGKSLQLRLNGKVINAAIIQSPLGCRFEIGNLDQQQANEILTELSKDYSIDIS